MGESIVLELQRLASDNSHDGDELLRKALVVATKLGISDFRSWITNELRGYDRHADVPEYRRIRAEFRVVNPDQGRTIPLILPVDTEKLFRDRALTQPIGPLSELLRSDSTTFQISMSPEERAFLISGQGAFPMEPIISVARSEIIRVVDAVRTAILDWALQLELEGIVGEGMSFSAEEREKAATTTSVHIGSFSGNFQGVIGDASNSEVIQRFAMNVRPGDLAALRTALHSAGVSNDDIDHLGRAIEDDPKPTVAGKFGSSVSNWLGAMLSKAASGAWELSAAAAAKVLVDAISAYYGLLRA